MFITVTVPYGTSVVVELKNAVDSHYFFQRIESLLAAGDKVTLETNGDQTGLETMSVTEFLTWLDMFGRVMLKRS